MLFKTVLSGIRMLVALTLLTGILYPLSVTAIAQVFFPMQANGSLLTQEETTIGSALIGQGTDLTEYFWSRPSAVDYMLGDSLDIPIASGSSNLGATSAVLAEAVAMREEAFRVAHQLSDDVAIPAEMLFASGSGLDPHISPESARLQIERVANSRQIESTLVAELVEAHIDPPTFGFLGQARVNVLLLNIALDGLAQSHEE